MSFAHDSIQESKKCPTTAVAVVFLCVYKQFSQHINNTQTIPFFDHDEIRQRQDYFVINARNYIETRTFCKS